MILELILLALSNFCYGVARTWDIQNLARGKITAAMVGSTLLNSTLWVLSSYIGMKGMILDGSIIHGIVYVVTASASALLMTWIRQKRDGGEPPEGNISWDRGRTLGVYKLPWNREKK